MREPNFPWQFFHEIAWRLTKFSIWLVICNWNLLSQDLYKHAFEILLILRITREQWNFAKFRLVALNNLWYEWNYIFSRKFVKFVLSLFWFFLSQHFCKKKTKIGLLKNEIYRNKYKFGENTQTSISSATKCYLLSVDISKMVRLLVSPEASRAPVPRYISNHILQGI